LVLTDNKIAGGLEALAAAGLAQLSFLDLSNNRISNLETLNPLVRLLSFSFLLFSSLFFPFFSSLHFFIFRFLFLFRTCPLSRKDVRP